MTHDSNLFRTACVDPAALNIPEYARFIGEMSATIDRVKRGEISDEQDPARIEVVYRARHLSKDGPASAAYAMYDFRDVMFVDVTMPLKSGKNYLNRTLVFQLADGTWRVMPRPDLVEILSMGLNDESGSTEVWRAAE